MIATRNNDVASLALDTYKLKLKPLGDDDAFDSSLEGLSRKYEVPLSSRKIV